MTTTYLFFYRACKVQGVDRSQFAYTGWLQPYCAWYGLCWMSMVVLFFGYTSFRPTFSIDTFFSNYVMGKLSSIVPLAVKR